MLSMSFTGWVLSLDSRERVLTPATTRNRNETFSAFFANRSSSK